MPYQHISAQLSADDIQTGKDAVATIEKKLPFLINLTAEERKAAFKAGAGSLAFLQNSLLAAKNNPGILPGNFTTTEFESDVNLFAALTDIGTVVAQLDAKMNDTRLAVGGEAMTEAAQVYNYVKTAAKTSPGLKLVASQLGERFQKASQQKAPAKPTA